MPIRVQVVGHGIVEFPDGTSQQEMAKALASLSQPAQPTSTAPAQPQQSPLRKAVGVVSDLATGAAKGLAHTGLDIASTAAQSGMIPGLTSGNLPPEVIDKAREATAYNNTTQRLGGLAETAAEFALPAVKGAEAVPTVAKAGAKFQSVMGAARNVAVDTNAPGEVALRIQQLAERGGSMPLVVRKFLNRITDPEKGQMVYEEARDFASNVSRLSRNEMGRLTPVMQREVANLRVTLNKAVAKAAEQAGKGEEYARAMSEYARAMRLRGVYDSFLEGVKKSAPYATGAGAGTWLAMRVRHYLSGD